MLQLVEEHEHAWYFLRARLIVISQSFSKVYICIKIPYTVKAQFDRSS